MTTIDLSGTGMVLLRNAEVYAPEHLGHRHILTGGGRILWMGEERPSFPSYMGVREVDLEGRTVIPGLVDGHCHVTGGGGEAGPASKVPAPLAESYGKAGVATVVGVLGTDDVTRSTAELVAGVRALRAQGIDAWCHTGGYHLPLTTLTGSVRSDIVNIDCIIGVGEVAISDHRSSQPTLDELLRIAADAHVAGLMTGKAGILHLHVGDGRRGLELIREALSVSEIPARVFNPTHVNRRKALLDEAIELVKTHGCTIDITDFPVAEGEDAYSAADALERYWESGAPLDRVTVSSDGGGCLPVFGADGQVVSYDVGDCSALMVTVRELVRRGHALEKVLAPFTRNVGRLLRLEAGALRVGGRSDAVIFGGAQQVIARLARALQRSSLVSDRAESRSVSEPSTCSIADSTHAPSSSLTASSSECDVRWSISSQSRRSASASSRLAYSITCASSSHSAGTTPSQRVSSSRMNPSRRRRVGRSIFTWMPSCGL